MTNTPAFFFLCLCILCPTYAGLKVYCELLCMSFILQSVTTAERGGGVLVQPGFWKKDGFAFFEWPLSDLLVTTFRLQKIKPELQLPRLNRTVSIVVLTWVQYCHDSSFSSGFCLYLSLETVSKLSTKQSFLCLCYSWCLPSAVIRVKLTIILRFGHWQIFMAGRSLGHDSVNSRLRLELRL